MGRHAGWIATFSGIAAAADFIFVHELPIDIAKCCEVRKASPGRGEELRHRRRLRRQRVPRQGEREPGA
ncbi:MAG: 6-phosphofructokinase [Isosphaeraceae bacterium]